MRSRRNGGNAEGVRQFLRRRASPPRGGDGTLTYAGQSPYPPMALGRGAVSMVLTCRSSDRIIGAAACANIVVLPFAVL